MAFKNDSAVGCHEEWSEDEASEDLGAGSQTLGPSPSQVAQAYAARLKELEGCEEPAVAPPGVLATRLEANACASATGGC